MKYLILRQFQGMSYSNRDSHKSSIPEKNICLYGICTRYIIDWVVMSTVMQGRSPLGDLICRGIGKFKKEHCK